MHYLWEHYSNGEDLRALVSQKEDGIAGIDAYLKASGYQESFRDVFRDWAVANFLDEERGAYSYGDFQVQANVLAFVDGFSQFTSEIPQYSVEYVELTSMEGAHPAALPGPHSCNPVAHRCRTPGVLVEQFGGFHQLNSDPLHRPGRNESGHIELPGLV